MTQNAVEKPTRLDVYKRGVDYRIHLDRHINNVMVDMETPILLKNVREKISDLLQRGKIKNDWKDHAQREHPVFINEMTRQILIMMSIQGKYTQALTMLDRAELIYLAKTVIDNQDFFLQKSFAAIGIVKVELDFIGKSKKPIKFNNFCNPNIAISSSMYVNNENPDTDGPADKWLMIYSNKIDIRRDKVPKSLVVALNDSILNGKAPKISDIITHDIIDVDCLSDGGITGVVDEIKYPGIQFQFNPKMTPIKDVKDQITILVEAGLV